MRKAVPWTSGNAGAEARDAARDAARRQGKSLGEWLQDAIVDETGSRENTARERMEAVTARLERLSAGAARMATPGAAAVEQRDNPVTLRRPRDQDSDESTRTDLRLERAIEAMERRARRREERTDDALASIADLIEANERRRDRERTSVEDLAKKLGALDAKLSDREPSPIRGTLARLEARLDQIGRRSEAESDARLGAGRTVARGDAEPMRRLEEKLNAVLMAVGAPAATSSQTSTLALGIGQGTVPPVSDVLPLRRRRLGDAIADISGRQRSLDGEAVGATPASAAVSHRAPPALDLDALRADIATMAEQLRDLAPRQQVAAVESHVARLERRFDRAGHVDGGPAIESLRTEVGAIGGRLDEIARSNRRPADAATADLERLVADLTRQMETAKRADAGQPAVDALERQVSLLAKRLDSTETGLASLAGLDRSMRDLFAQLEETRSIVESTASRAAQDAVRTVVSERGFERPAPRADVAVLKAMQEDADLRTRATLDVVHQALDKVVDRLSRLEQGLQPSTPPADRRQAETAPERPTMDEAPAPALRPPRPSLRLDLGAAEPMLEPDMRPIPQPAAASSAATRADLDAGGGRAGYIAAARRAVQSAQTDPTVLAMRRPVPPTDQSCARAGLIAKSRDYVAQHKRPVLMSIAALLVVAGTAALIQHLPSSADGPQVAEAPAPVRTASAVTAPTRPAPAARARPDDLSPSALPHGTPAIAARIPGSDPVVTGSIPSLPAFAARADAPIATARPPGLPPGLVAAANSGDGAAQFTLASAYAEGRLVPRDLARAAGLYAKAADAGIVPAQYRLGALYEKGLGVAQDKARAMRLYRQAADAGNPRAMHNLAVLLADGDGKPDYEGAAIWFRKAAQEGVHDSQYNLAILLARGLGVEASLVQSYQWFAIAADQGDKDAAQKRDEVAGKLSPSELSVAKALATAFHARLPDPAAIEVSPPAGGWDSAPAPLHLNSGRSKIS